LPQATLKNGATLNWGEAGAGKPLVLVHGSPGDGRAWGRVIGHLPTTRRMLTPDLPGYGGSDALPSGTERRTEAMAEAIDQLIDSQGEDVWLSGHSYGANVALHAALSAKQRVRGVVLFEPVLMRALELAGEREELANTRAFFEAYLGRIDANDRDAIGLMVDFWFGPRSYARLPASMREFLKSAAHKNAVDVRASFAEQVSAKDISSFDRPVVIVCGGASPPVTATIAKALGGMLPAAEVKTIPGATHAMLDTHPQAVAQMIDQHCR
jgi:pimeloyl-ACP methyl ester carboxylesterase